MWGLGAALICFLIYMLTDRRAWGALAEIGAWINLFNLTPVWQLDGAHGFQALTKQQRLVVGGVVGAAWLLSGKGILLLLLIAVIWNAFGREAPPQPDRRTLLEFVVLIAALTALATIPVPVAALD
jgi:Zn-dependent protease